MSANFDRLLNMSPLRGSLLLVGSHRGLSPTAVICRPYGATVAMMPPLRGYHCYDAVPMGLPAN